jgi:hypothetical protein
MQHMHSPHAREVVHTPSCTGPPPPRHYLEVVYEAQHSLVLRVDDEHIRGGDDGLGGRGIRGTPTLSTHACGGYMLGRREPQRLSAHGMRCMWCAACCVSCVVCRMSCVVFRASCVVCCMSCAVFRASCVVCHVPLPSAMCVANAY